MAAHLLHYRTTHPRLLITARYRRQSVSASDAFDGIRVIAPNFALMTSTLSARKCSVRRGLTKCCAAVGDSVLRQARQKLHRDIRAFAQDGLK